MATHVAGLFRALDCLMQTDSNPASVIEKSESLWKCRTLRTGSLFKDGSEVMLVCEAGPWDMKVMNLVETETGDYKIDQGSRCKHVCVIDFTTHTAAMGLALVDIARPEPAGCIFFKAEAGFTSVPRFAFTHCGGHMSMATVSSLCSDVLGSDCSQHKSLTDKVRAAMQTLECSEAEISAFLVHVKTSSQQKRKSAQQDEDEEVWEDSDVYDQLLEEDKEMEEGGDELAEMLQELIEEEEALLLDDGRDDTPAPDDIPASDDITAPGTYAPASSSNGATSTSAASGEVVARMDWRHAATEAEDWPVPEGCRLDLKRKGNQQPFWQATLPARMKFEGTSSKSYSFRPLGSEPASSRCVSRSEQVAKRLAAQWLWNWHAARST